ncbi:MAG: phenylalanine--tRNA ligase subunit alpha [Nanoarchaeota archaeon]|nr:phenylalanine--tRNA ligase subunit alpha [Nanoarchaeota archaeon]
MSNQMEKIIEKLSPMERKIIPFLNLSIEEIEQKSSLDSVSTLRALKFLENKDIIKIKKTSKKIIDLGTNGIYYKNNHLPERKLLTLLEQNKTISLQEAEKLSKLSENEFKVSLGILKNKAFIEIKNGKIVLTAKKEEITKKFLEEHLIEMLPIEESKLAPESKHALENLKRRKNIVEIKELNLVEFELTSIGQKLAGKEIKSDLIEELTPEIIKNWNKTKKFRTYDIQSPVPSISGGKKHFVNEAIEYAKRIWLDLGFKEMSGNMIETGFWNFDALFTAQDHPAREMQDTFFIKDIEGVLPSKEIVSNVKKAHEKGIEGSKGWGYEWKEKEAKKVALRTHTTCVSARTLASLKPSDLPAKYFIIEKVFRNETLDWKHGFEFYQTEGIVIDEKVNFTHLLGFLKEFYKKMGFDKIKLVPSYFAYTEPSVEVQVFHEGRKEWLELGGAGVFRPEVTIPLLGKNVRVLAWGQGFDRIITDYYKIKDLRELYSNDLKELRNKKAWIK